MATGDSTTTYYALLKPPLGGAPFSYGASLNANMDSIDGLIHTNATAIGSVNATTGKPTALVVDKATVAFGAGIFGKLNGINRWAIEVGDNSPEGTGTAGSNFSVSRYNNAGVFIDTPLTVSRANGQATFLQPLNCTAQINANGGISCKTTVSTVAVGAGHSYVGFFDATPTRQGYVGWLNGTSYVALVKDGGASISVGSAITLSGAVTTTGAVTIGGTLTTSLSATIGSTLNVKRGSNTRALILLNDNTLDRGLVQYDASTAQTSLQMITGVGIAGSSLVLDASANFTFNGSGVAYKAGGGAWAAISDERVKDVLNDYDAGLSEVLRLRPVTYRLKGEDKVHIGLVAQAAELVMPELVSMGKGEIDGKEVDDLRSLDPSAILYALINAVKDLKREVDELRGEGAVSTKFAPLQLPPGVVANATKKMSSSNYSEANLVRWVEGQLTPIGPQSKRPFAFASRCKRIHGWFGIDQVWHVAYLCEAHLYVDTGGALLDITPTGGLVIPAPAVGGYGDGNYSDGSYNYNEPPPIGHPTQIDKIPDAFSLDNFGAILLAMTSTDSRLLFWDPAAGGLAAPVAASHGTMPQGRCFVVTQERFIQIFGAFDAVNGGGFRRFAWCNQEDYTDWDYLDVTKQAGFIDIEPSSPIITATSTHAGTLFWTAKHIYRSRFLGLPYIFNYEEVGEACTPWSPASVTSTPALTVWMSQQGAFSYDGTSVLPVKCPVRPWVDDDIDLLNVREQACCVHVWQFNEVWWFFPQLGQPYNTRCIYFDYKDGWWCQGRMARSAGMHASYTSHTIMANGLVAYMHEAEDSLAYWDADLPWVETFDINLASGGMLTTVKQLIPDVEGASQNLLYSLFYRNSRSIGESERQSPKRGVRQDGYVDFRTTGRDIRLRIDLVAPVGTRIDATGAVGGSKEPINISTGAILPVTVGQHLIDVVPRGDR